MIHYRLILLFSLALVLASCVNNEDELTPVLPEEQLPLSNSSLKGTWEQYYYTKSINGGSKMRYVDFDGYMITFFEDSTFYESNAGGDQIVNGNYKVVSKDSIQFTFPLYDENKVFRKDTVTKVNIGELSTKRFTYINDYKLGSYKIKDVRVWRNMQTMPSEHPGVEKESVDVLRLKGVWRLESYSKFINAQLSSDSADKEILYKGTRYQFNADNTYKEINPSGQLGTEGNFKIVDDVVHLFYTSRTQNDPLLKDMSSTIWIRDWGTRSDNGIVVEEFTIYDNYFEYSNETSSILNIQTRIRMRKVI